MILDRTNQLTLILDRSPLRGSQLTPYPTGSLAPLVGGKEG